MCRQPPELGGRRNGIDPDHQCQRDQYRARYIDTGPDAQADVFADQDPAEHEGEHPDGHVDEEDPVPAQRLSEDAADQEADRSAPDGHEDIGAHRLRPFGWLRKLGDDDGDDGRCRKRAADPLEEPAHHQHGLGLRQTTGDRRAREEHDSGQEDLATSDQVTEPAGHEQKAAEADQEGSHHPGQARRREVQLLLDVRQGHVDDGRVERVHEHGQTYNDKCPPAQTAGSRRARRRR